ncbi:DUF6278 family protein [Streptacidiphilus griseoplanus]|uniref:DUF6278 family protein n=1 Tax=Peterkaempfera griseoplana TaxID=66896 RepID=UPI0006E1D2D1|nr:DUF6278 family protein [Peterkaempfera griseoplana]
MWRARRVETAGAERTGAAAGEGIGELLAECELLREQADGAGIALDDSPQSLAALDQMQPRWRDDPETSEWLGNDAGLYLGTVIVRTVPGAVWRVWPRGNPVVVLPGGRELDVVEIGHGWAADGYPELSAAYAEVRVD